MRTRQEKRKQLQTKKRRDDSAALTRNETALNDGLYRRQRQQAEDHIASLICRFAYFDSSTKKWRLARGKAKEVFEFHATKTYSDLNVGFSRVRDRAYRQLKEKKVDLDEIPVSNEETTNVS